MRLAHTIVLAVLPSILGVPPPPLGSLSSLSSGREELTPQECEDGGGIIVGDIGNGAIFGVGYLCESNGLPPIAAIVQDGTQIAIEGAVCCGKAINANRKTLTRQQCFDQGGEIVGDIGDSATRARAYLCTTNGRPPIADIMAGAEEPISSEGEVCCGTNGIKDNADEEESSGFLHSCTLFVVLTRILTSLLL